MDKFKNIEKSFESQQKLLEKDADKQTRYNQEETTDDSLGILKLVKHMPNTEIKNNFDIFKDIRIPNSQLNEENQEKREDDEYADYGRRNKNGIHFQLISDYNVSIEIVPEDILDSKIQSLLDQYKAVFDPSMKLWILPYVNYFPLYCDLVDIKEFKYKIYKIGSIAKKCYENKSLTKLEIKRKLKEEIIDYTKDNKERSVDTLPKSLKNALYDFQFDGIKFGVEHHCRFLLADEMGVGKTIQAISLCYLYREEWPVLIVCPGSMKYLWKGEIQTWLGFKDHRINVLNSSKQKISEEAYFYIISYDLVSHILKKLKKMKFNFVILDEAHCIKNRDTIRAKNILPIAIRAKRLILMTGTPLLAKPLEGYPLLYALRPDLFPYFKQYAYRYCDPQPTPFGISWSGTSNTKELHWLLSTLMVRRLKKEVLNKLPPKRRQKVEIKTDKEILEKIKETRTKVKGRNGTLQAYTLTSTAKKDGVCEYVHDILTDSEEKIIVFAYHHEMMNCVEDLLKKENIDYIRIDGSTKQDKRYEYVKYYQNKKECRVAIVSIIAGSTGITLNKAHIVIFAELTWTPSIMIQAEDRAHRIGQKK
jgi:SWI/SNF-related matrix-associated actin-dependent regulator 1 of chromatin subfamily A